jgi:hypothetical protein
VVVRIIVKYEVRETHEIPDDTWDLAMIVYDGDESRAFDRVHGKRSLQSKEISNRRIVVVGREESVEEVPGE